MTVERERPLRTRAVGAVVHVGHGTDNNAFPSYSPDGNRLVFRSFSKSGQDLRIMNLESKTVTTLTSDYDNFPLWSPRGI